MTETPPPPDPAVADSVEARDAHDQFAEQAIDEALENEATKELPAEKQPTKE